MLAVVTFLLAGGLLTAGATAALAGASLRDDQGYLMSRFTTLTTPGAAVSSESLRLRSDASSTLPRRLLGDAKVEVRAPAGPQVFVGLARTRDAKAYLTGVAYSTVVDPAPGWPIAHRRTGTTRVASPPSRRTRWTSGRLLHLAQGPR